MPKKVIKEIIFLCLGFMRMQLKTNIILILIKYLYPLIRVIAFFINNKK